MYAIELKNVVKRYTITKNSSFGRLIKTGTTTALDDVTISVPKHVIIGIIGRNGSGKSTLMKLLSKITFPDEGIVTSHGKIVSILELNIGFERNESGFENIRLKCELYGLTNKGIDEVIENIIKFSGLRERIHDPIKTYSSGMIAKLALAIILNIPSDILLIDEVLSVCDSAFISKCCDKITKDARDGKTIILSSHSLQLINMVCNYVYWIEGGKLIESGNVTEVCSHYYQKETNSFEILLEKAVDGDPISQNKLGMMYRDGVQIQKDLVKAEQYFSQAADAGLVEALLNLAELKISLGNIQDAIPILEAASLKGNVIATSRLYLLKNGQTDEIEEKLTKLRTMAEQGNIEAAAFLASILYQGKMTNRNYVEALKWYRVCAESGKADAQYMLGICNETGIGTSINADEAIYWFKKASNQNHVKSMISLAEMYRNGTIVKRNVGVAIEYYTMAANLNDETAMIHLRDIFLDKNDSYYNIELGKYWENKYTISTNKITLNSLDQIIDSNNA